MNGDPYRESVHRLMVMNSEEFISNGQPQHASALFECFFLFAKRNIKILCQSLRADVFDRPEVLEAATEALGRGVSFEVIVQEKPPEGSLFLKLLSEDKFSPGQVAVTTEANSISSAIAMRRENFAVMDNRAVRYEDDSSKCEAVASMNRPELARVLSSVFFRLKASLAYVG